MVKYSVVDKKVILSTELVLQPSVSQNKKTVSGIVKDENGEPIIGANVIEKGTANGTVTDMDGKYTLEVSSSTVVLQLSYIGYLTKGKATHLPFIKDGQEVHLALFLKQKPEHQETIRYFLPEDIIETI